MSGRLAADGFIFASVRSETGEARFFSPAAAAWELPMTSAVLTSPASHPVRAGVMRVEILRDSRCTMLKFDLPGTSRGLLMLESANFGSQQPGLDGLREKEKIERDYGGSIDRLYCCA